jgi:NAD(P)-dependent dehydrogenase (short-subunit alcohol dehydrogenase family)
MSRHIRELVDLSGRTALIAGGSRWLGLQVAEALGEAGAKLLLTARKELVLRRTDSQPRQGQWIRSKAFCQIGSSGPIAHRRAS